MKRSTLSVAMIVILLGTGQARAASFQGLGFLGGGDWSLAFGVSADGSVVVGESDSRMQRSAFRWTAQTGMVDIGYGTATDVSADGSVVVGGRGRWTAETGWVDVGYLSVPDDRYVNAVSADGSVVVGTINSDPGWKVFVWTADAGIRTLQDDFGLDLSNWFNLQAEGISADGRVIVGFGDTQLPGGTQAFRAVIPEPSGLAMLTAAAVVLLACVRRRRRFR